MPLISFYKKGIYDVVPVSDITPEEALQWIRDGKFKKEIEYYRSIENIHTKGTYKETLPYFTWSGTFKKRNAAGLIEHSGIICIDLDHVFQLNSDTLQSDITELKTKLFALPWVLAVFISPSGDGLKVLVKINGKKHAPAFIALKKYFQDHLKLTVDEKAKDIPRACFVSYDEHCIWKEKCDTFNPAEPAQPPDTDEKQSGSSFRRSGGSAGDDYLILFARARRWALKNCGEYNPGNRNEHIFQFACQCNRLGIPEEHTQQFSLNEFADFPEKSLRASITSAYKNHTNEHGNLQNGRVLQPTGTQFEKKTSTSNEETSDAAAYHEDLIFGEYSNTKKIYSGQFWLRTITYNDDETIKEEKVTCNYVALAKFLSKNGYSRLPIKRKNAPDIFQFVRTQQNIVKQVNEQNMKDFVFDWMEENKVPEKVVEAFIRGSKNYFNINTLDRVPLRDLTFKRDTREESFYYYQDCYVRVTKEGIEPLEYEDLDAPIWQSQKLERNFSIVDDISNCVFTQFLWAAATGKEDVRKEDKNLMSRFLSICSGIGYMLHSFKDETNAKTFNIFDAKISYEKKPEGRSGKSMIFRAIGKMKPTVILDGKKIDLRKPESFAKVNLDTAVIVFNDVSRNFNFEMLFHMITEEITVKKLYMDLFSIAFEDSPKIGITGNYTLKGDGGSFTARQFNVTLTDFFNPENRPDEYFGRKLYPDAVLLGPDGELIHCKHHRFFHDWDEKEFNRFDSFMLQCVQQYLANGLLVHDDPNYELKKLLDEVDFNFYDFMQEQPRNTDLMRTAMFNEFKELHAPDFDNMKMNTFTKWLVRYCDFKNIKINPHKPAKGNEKFGRDRRAGEDYIFLEGSKEKKLWR